MGHESAIEPYRKTPDIRLWAWTCKFIPDPYHQQPFIRQLLSKLLNL